MQIDMTEKEWLECEDIYTMFHAVNEYIDDRKRRLIGLACCRAVYHLIDDRVKPAVDVIERHADNKAFTAELIGAKHEVDDIINDMVIEYNDFSGNYIQVESHAVYIDTANIVLEATSTSGVAFYNTLTIINDDIIQCNEIRLDGIKCAADILIDIVNPFQPEIPRNPSIIGLAETIYWDKDYSLMPILGDALEDVGVDERILKHCRSGQRHYKGCWVVDGILGY